VRMRIRSSLAALLVSVALTPASADGASPQPGGQYFGATSQGGNVVVQVTRNGGRVASIELELRARCIGRRLVHPVKAETVSVRGLGVDAGGRFGRLGRIAKFDSGPGGIDERFPVVVTGSLAGAFLASRRLYGTARLTLRVASTSAVARARASPASAQPVERAASGSRPSSRASRTLG
jgi:hypothetical protein